MYFRYIFSNLISLTEFGEKYKLQSSSLPDFLRSLVIPFWLLTHAFPLPCSASTPNIYIYCTTKRKLKFDTEKGRKSGFTYFNLGFYIGCSEVNIFSSWRVTCFSKLYFQYRHEYLDSWRQSQVTELCAHNVCKCNRELNRDECNKKMEKTILITGRGGL